METPPTNSQQSETNQEEVQPPTTQVKKRSGFGTIIMIFLLFLLIGCLGVLSYLYFKKDSSYKKLLTEKQSLEEQNTSLTSEKETLQGEKTTLEEENTSLEEEIASYNTHEAKIKIYNDFLDYTFDVIRSHGGFYGLTDAEYQTARGIAETTGDADFVAQVDSAWNDTYINQVTRFINLMDFINTRISENLSLDQ